MRRELLVGLVFTALLALLLGITLWVEEPGFFRESGEFEMRARFDDVAGLEEGSPVWVNGAESGRVAAVRQDGQGGVAVDLDLDFDPGLREDARVKIQPRSALGGAVVSIQPGTPSQPPLPEGTVLRGEAVSDPFQELGELIAEVRGPLRETLENARKVTGDFSTRSERIARDVDEFAANAREISDDLAEGRGTLGRLLKDEQLHADLESAVATLKQIADDAQGGGGTIDVLLHDRQLADDLRSGVASLRSVGEKLERGEGTLGKLIEDPQLYDDLSATVADLRTMVGDAREGRGLLGRLVYDEAMADRFDQISSDVAQVTGKLRRGEGTLGRLIQDEELYSDLKNALATLSGGVEDARENAPILTFAGFLFSGF